MNVLVTGGAGYIGSHACVELLNAGHSVVVADNLVNANAECLRRVERITGKTLEKEVNVRNRDHFAVQLKTKAHIFRNRKLYNRKVKHKKVEIDD